MTDFCPYYPKPHKTKSSLFFRFFRGLSSWIDVLFEKSYSMKMGHVKQFGLDLYMVNEPEIIKRILIDEAEHFPKHALMHNMLKDLLGDSVFTTNGDVWKHQREILNHAFTTAKVSRLFPQMKDSVDTMISRISEFMLSNKEDYLEVDSEMTHITADIIFRAILSKSLEKSDSHEIYNAFIEYQDLSQKMVTMKLFKIPLWRFYKRGVLASAKKIRNFILKIIDERLAKSEKAEKAESSIHDMLDVIMNNADSNDKKFSREELLDQINMLFLAGHETSAASLAWSIYLIANSDEIQNNLYLEIKEHFGSGEIDQQGLSKLKYTQSVFNESLRLFPPVSFFLRESMVDQMIGDKHVKKGSVIVISPWLMHRHRKIWIKPDTFCPSRFVEKKEKSAINHAYLPFSKGPRTCPGAGFATQEGVLILASIVKHFKIQPHPDHVPIPSAKVTLRAKNCIKVKFIARF